MTEETKARVVQEYVPGKQVTLAQVICNPRPELCSLIGVEKSGAIGIMTITPGEGAIIAADIASKSSDIAMDFIDRFTGCVLFTGDVAAVESSLEGTVRTLALPDSLQNRLRVVGPAGGALFRHVGVAFEPARIRRGVVP